MTTRASRGRFFSPWMLLILTFGGALRIPGMTESLWFDELWCTDLVVGSSLALAKQFLTNVHPPFYAVFMFLWTKVFGDSELAIRLPSLLFGLLSIWLVYVIARTLADRKTGLISALLLAVSPAHIWYSQEARPYSALIALLLIATFAYLRLRENRASRLLLAALSASMFVAVFTHYFMIVYVVLFPALAWRSRHPACRAILWHHGIIFLVFALFFAAKSAISPQPSAMSYLRAFTFTELYALLFNWFIAGNVFETLATHDGRLLWIKPLFYFAQAVFTVIFLRGAVLLVRDRSGAAAWEPLLLLFFMPAVLLVLCLVGYDHIYIERSLLAILPFFCLAMARGLTQVRRAWVRAPIMAFVGLFIIATLCVFYSSGARWTVYKPNPDWRAAAQYIDSELRSKDDTMTLFAATGARVLVYYDERVAEMADSDAAMEAKMATLVRYLGADHFVTRTVRQAANRYVDQRKERLRSARVTIHYPSAEEFNIMLAKRGESSLYLIRNHYWEGRSGELYAACRADPRLCLVHEFAAKGITIYKWGVCE